jgi:trimeric autotransporter adhesin
MSKNYIMIMVALMALLTIMLPVSAVVVGKDISQGATVFLGEEGLDITNAVNTAGGVTTIGWWASAADIQATSPSQTIQVSGRASTFEITQSEFSGYTGSWYRLNPSTGLSYDPAQIAFTVSEPRISVSIRNAADGAVSTLDEKTIVAGTPITFKIDTNVILNDKRGDVTTTTFAPIANFAVALNSATGNVTFTDTSTNSPTARMWTFDGNPSANTNASVTFTKATAPATIKLDVSNAANNGASDTNSSKSATITITGPAYTGSVIVGVPSDPNPTTAPYASFNGVVSSGGNVALTDLSSGVPTTWNWSYANGTVFSTVKNPPVFQFSPVNGAYTIFLTVADASNPVVADQSRVGGVVTITNPIYTLTTTYDVPSAPVAPIPVSKSISGLNTANGYIDIIVRSNGGTTYSSLQNMSGQPANLKNQFINTAPYYWNGGSPSGSTFVGDKWKTDAKTSGGQRIYQNGIYSVYAECNLNGMKDNYKVTGKSVSETQTVTLGSDTLQIESNKATVVRGKSFAITLTGQPSTDYVLFMKSISPTADNAPNFILYQEGVNTISKNASTVTTDSSGVRIVEFSTSSDTKEQKYTIRAESLTGTIRTDEITVSVTKGGMTLVASGNQNYYLGEEIKLSGINTETETTYFFVIGPNLRSSGAQLESPSDAVITGDESTFADSVVEADDTFKYTWSTSGVDLDAGTYTIYAVSEPVDKNDLGDVVYSSVSIGIKKPYVSAAISQPTIAKGDKVFVEGRAEGNPSSGVTIWILGKNYAKRATQSIDSDASYKYEIKQGETSDMASGQYFIVVQHPMQNDIFDVYQDGQYVYKNTGNGDPISIFKLEGSGSLQGSDAAEALIQAINDPNIDDTYTKLNVLVQEPLIAVDPISNKNIGDKFTLTGKTNLAVEDEILVEIYSSSFKPTQKTQSGEFSGATGNVKVNKSETGLNKFSLDVDTSTFKADEYIVVAQGVTQEATGTTLFTVVTSGAPLTTTAPVGTPTPSVTPIVTAPTPIVTAPPTVVPTPSVPVPTETTKSPGFGAVFALIGLGAVGFIVVRRH